MAGPTGRRGERRSALRGSRPRDRAGDERESGEGSGDLRFLSFSTWEKVRARIPDSKKKEQHTHTRAPIIPSLIHSRFLAGVPFLAGEPAPFLPSFSSSSSSSSE